MDTLVVTKRSQLTDIADAIRAKTGKSDEITLNDMPNEISEIGGGDNRTCYVDIESQLPNNVEVMVNLSANVIVEDGGKYYIFALYNGVRLPRIPEDVLRSYPYCWIRNNTTTGYYDLLLSSSPWWVSENTATSTTISTANYAQGIRWYRVLQSEATSATSWTFNRVWNTSGGFGAESNRPIMWSNHDIPNGSATATDIYFNGSEPVLTD